MSLEVFLFFSLLEKFKKDEYEFFMCLVEFACEAIWSWTFVCRECFYYIFNFISFFFFLFLFSFYCLLRTAPMAYGGSQASG